MNLKMLVAGVAMMSGATMAATEKTWSNTAGDWDLGNAENWGGTLPDAPDYMAKIATASTEDQPYVMAAKTEVKSAQVTLTKGMVFDLGIGSKFLSTSKFLVSTTDPVTLKSGMLGVDWDASTERFFIGDATGCNDSLFVVDGPHAILSSSCKNNIQVGTNRTNCWLVVRNGGTVRGNVVVGNNASAAGNHVWIEGSGSKHTVPSDSGASNPLCVGGVGAYATYVLTNQASFVNESTKTVSVGGGSGTRADGGNVLEIRDHSSFVTAGNLEVSGTGSYGNGSGSNLLVVAGLSTLKCAALKVGAQVKTLGNRMEALDGAFVRATSLVVGDGNSGNMSADNEVVVSNATVDVSGNFVLGSYNGANCNRFRVQKDGLLVLTNETAQRMLAGNYGRDCLLEFDGGVFNASNRVFFVGYEAAASNNQLIVNGGSFIVTNSVSTTFVSTVGAKGCNNRMIVANGGTVQIINTLSGGNQPSYFCIGSEATAECNELVISNGARWCQTAVNGTKASWTIGSKGANNGCLVDGGTMEMPVPNGMIVNVGTSDSASNCWFRIRNGSTVTLDRMIVGSKGKNCELTVDDSALAVRQFQFGDVANSGSKFTIGGDKAKVDATTLTLGPGMTLDFKIDKRGLRTDGAVMTVTNGVSLTSGKVSAEDPVTVKIDAGEKSKAGTYTLMQVTGNNQKIDWTNVNLDYDTNVVKIVEQSSTKLVAKVRNGGLMILLR